MIFRTFKLQKLILKKTLSKDFPVFRSITWCSSHLISGKKNPGINPAAAACSFTGSNSPSARDNSVVVGRLQAELTHPALNSLLPANREKRVGINKQRSNHSNPGWEILENIVYFSILLRGWVGWGDRASCLTLTAWHGLLDDDVLTGEIASGKILVLFPPGELQPSSSRF